MLQQSFAFVATDDGVLACINSNTGVAEWRVVLPEGTSVDELVTAENRLFTLSRNDRRAVVSSWYLDTGFLDWEIYLEPSSLGNSNDFPTDVVVDVPNKRLTVLFSNLIHFISTTGNLEWIWEPSTESSTSSLVVSQLAVLLTTQGKEKSDTIRVAIGCTVSSSGTGSIMDKTCTSTVLVTVDHKKRISAREEYPGEISRQKQINV